MSIEILLLKEGPKLSNRFGSFGNGPNGYVSYKVFQESQKSSGGGGKGPASNSGCLSAVFFALAIVSVVSALLSR